MGCHDDSEINLQVDFESFIFLEIIAKALANSIWQVTTFCKNVFPKPTHTCNMIFLLMLLSCEGDTPDTGILTLND